MLVGSCKCIDVIPEAPNVLCARCGFRTRVVVIAYEDGDKDYDCECGLPLVRIREGKIHEWESNVVRR